MANTKVTSSVLADDAVNISNINTVDATGGGSSPSADGQALVAKNTAGTNDYYLDWATVSGSVAGISSSADATAITIGSDESVDFAKGIVVEGSGTLAGVYLNGTNSDTATQGNFVRYGTNFATQSNAANSNLITKTFNGSTFVDAHVISSAGRTGLHTTSPDAELHIEPVSSNASIVLSNDGRTQYYRIQNNESADALTFNLSDASEKLRIQSGGGISFNGDTATANALDDYEEGTWTPTYSGHTGLSSVSGITSASGYYVKVGKLVQVSGIFTMNGSSSNNINDGDNIRITGLPYESQGGWISQIGTAYTTNAFVNRGSAFGPSYRYSSYYVIQFSSTSGISAAWAGDEANTVYFQQTFKIA